MRLSVIILPFLFLLSFLNEKTNGQCNYKIDTERISNNSNLDALLNSLRSTKLKTKNKKSAIPFFVTNLINCYLKTDPFGDTFTIADPKEPYNKYDEILPDRPNRKLVYLGLGQNLLLMTYHHGGMGAGTSHIVIVKFSGSKIIDFWSGEAAKLETKKSVIEWLEKYKKDKQKELVFF